MGAGRRRFKSCRSDGFGMPYFVYVLRSRRHGRRYVGSCADLEDRLRRHNAGRSRATKSGVPWELIHTERFDSRQAAMARERFFKAGTGREILDRLAGVTVCASLDEACSNANGLAYINSHRLTPFTRQLECRRRMSRTGGRRQKRISSESGARPFATPVQMP